MSGKVHSIIGITTAALLGSAYMLYSLGAIDSSTLLLLMSGSLAGSLMPDIDSKRSKASQKFTSLAIIFLSIFTIIAITNSINNKAQLTIVQTLETTIHSVPVQWVKQMLEQVTDLSGLLVFLMLTTVGKLSPHRGFTHKVMGTFCFCTVAFIAFNNTFATGFTSGYLLHILADKMTPAGLTFLELVFPLQKSNGSFVSPLKIGHRHANKK